MRCYLAAFDQAHRSADGSYWTWRHPNVPSRALDAFYYDCAAKHWPDDVKLRPWGCLRGGCACVDDDWVVWYRIADGGRDKSGRSGRYVLLAAFIERDDHFGRDWSGILESPIFETLVGQARTMCPVPSPERLELNWYPPPLAAGGAMADELCSRQPITVAGPNALSRVAGICSAVRPGSRLDCFFVRDNGTAVLTLDPPEGIHARQYQQSEPYMIGRQDVDNALQSGLRGHDAESQPVHNSWAMRFKTQFHRRRFKLISAFMVVFACGLVAGWILHSSLASMNPAPQVHTQNLGTEPAPDRDGGDWASRKQ